MPRNSNKKRAPTVVSLFTGAGGLDLGMESAGFQNVGCVEMNPAAVQTLRANQKRFGEILDKSIHAYIDEAAPLEQRATRLVDELSLSAVEVDLLIGGPPCQPFSKSGYWATGDSKRLTDPRAKTLDAYFDVVAGLRPAVFLLENVPGLSYAGKNEGLKHIEVRIEELNEKLDTNYIWSAKQLNAAEFGVPQLRKRVFVVAHREGEEFSFPEATHRLPPPVNMATGSVGIGTESGSDTSLLPATTAWDAIGGVELHDDPGELVTKGKWAPVLPTIPEGANYLWHTRRGGGLDSLWGWRTRYWSMLLKLAKNRPSWTITAQPGPSIGPFHWDSRRLDRNELARLQTFPDDFRITGSLREAQTQLGNAVPSALAEVLGIEIGWQFFGMRRRKPRLIPEHRNDTPPAEAPMDPERLPKQILELVKRRDDHAGPGKGPAYVHPQSSA